MKSIDQFLNGSLASEFTACRRPNTHPKTGQMFTFPINSDGFLVFPFESEATNIALSFYGSSVHRHICFVGVRSQAYPMARKNAPPSVDKTLAATKPSKAPNVPRPNTRSSKMVPSAYVSLDEASDGETNLLTLPHPSFVATKVPKNPGKGSKGSATTAVARLRHPDAPVDFDRRKSQRNDGNVPPKSSRLIPLTSPSHPPPQFPRAASNLDDDHVQRDLDEFSNGHFNESDDSDAAVALLQKSATISPSAPAVANGFGEALNDALGSPSRSSSPSFEASSSEEEYLEGLTDAILSAADGDEQTALMETKMQRLEQKRMEHMEDKRAYRDWRAGRPAVLKGKAKEGALAPPRRSVITKKDKEILKVRLDVHNAEWEEMADSLGIEYDSIMQYLFQLRTSRRNNKWCVWSRLYSAEHPGHGLDSNELAMVYKKEKAVITKKGKDKLADWFVENRRKLEELEGEVVFDSMSASTRTKRMVKIAQQISETSRVCNNNWQFEVFGFIMNRSILDGQATSNSQMFSSSKTTAKILEKLIWNNVDLRKKLQTELMNVETSSNTIEAPSLEMWDAYRKTLVNASGSLVQDDVRAAVSSRMMNLLRMVMEEQSAESSLPRGFPWHDLTNFIYLNRPSFKIRNWPSTVPFSGIGEMNARHSRILLQSLVVGFVYQEEGSDETRLRPNSRIEFEPFNPSDEERASTAFGKVTIMSDELGNPFFRIRHSSKWRNQSAHQAIEQEKATKVNQGSRARGRAHLEVNKISRVPKNAGNNQDADSEDEPTHRSSGLKSHPVKGKSVVKSKKPKSVEHEAGTSKGRRLPVRTINDDVDDVDDNNNGEGNSDSGDNESDDDDGHDEDKDDEEDEDDRNEDHVRPSSPAKVRPKVNIANKGNKGKAAGYRNRQDALDDDSEDHDSIADRDAQKPRSKSNVTKARAALKGHGSSATSQKAKGESSQARAQYSVSEDDFDDEEQPSTRSKSSPEKNHTTKAPKKVVTKLKASGKARARYSESEDDVDDNARPSTRSKSSPKKNSAAMAPKKAITKAKDTSRGRYDTTRAPGGSDWLG